MCHLGKTLRLPDSPSSPASLFKGAGRNVPCRPVAEGPGHFQGAGQPAIPSSSHTLSSRLKEDAEIPRTKNQVWILDTPSPSKSILPSSFPEPVTAATLVTIRDCIGHRRCG